MKDARYRQLADLLTCHSTQLKKGESVLIDAFDVPEEMVGELISSVKACGAYPFVSIKQGKVLRALYAGATEKQIELMNKIELERMKKMDAYIALRGSNNIFEFSDIPAEKMKIVMEGMRPTQNWRVRKTKWVVLRWPSSSMAMQSRMSTEAFEDFYFDVCAMDYSRMIPGSQALKKLLLKTDRVEIKGPGTDLRFSIKGIMADSIEVTPARYNVPDGECFTAPVKLSVEGHITYNTPSVYQGNSFDGIYFEFKKGKIIKAEAGAQTKRINEILDSDKGARYIGEFAIAFNPKIKEPMRDTLFDEKIAGSFHLTPGQAYDVANNGNKSQVHWDLVSIQRPEYGGGEIYFDGKLIRKDGIFVAKGLEKLNPDYLLGAK